MTLEEWIALTPEERNRERRQWTCEGEGYWYFLLEEACERFKREFGEHSLINHISAWRLPLFDPSIVVTTALWWPQLIEELPDRYCTFGVHQKPIEDNKHSYLRTWTLVLSELLGWSTEQVRAWARAHHEDGLDGKEAFFYHDGPLDYIVWLLAPEDLRHRLSGPPRLELERKLIEAIERHGSDPLWLSPYDWGAAKIRIKGIFDEHENGARVIG
jgi:hypothetical protein